MKIARIVGIWVSGLVATSLLGAGIAIFLSGGGDAPFTGFLAGLAAFTCFRLWIGEMRHGD